jgi:hypothetical protein
LAVVLLATVVVVFMGAAFGFAFSQRWRQSERLVAPGLRHPRGVAVVRSDLLAVAEAGPPGRLTWISTSESARGTVVEGLPSEELGGGQAGPVAVALGPDLRLYALTGGCAEALCASLLSRAGSRAPPTARSTWRCAARRPWRAWHPTAPSARSWPAWPARSTSGSSPTASC